MRLHPLFLLAALAASLVPALSPAQENAHSKANVESSARDGVLKLLPADSITEHGLTIGGRKIAYTATAGTLDLFGQDGAQTGAIFYTAYVAKDSGPDRPLTFAFNGGPGAASAFLHLGLVGPKVLDFGPQSRDGAHAKLVDNPQSWLDFTDLVLIDPIGTGWSRTVKADDASNYYNVNSDAQSIAKAIALYVAHANRSNSPKYLLGESYGGFRAAKVASALQESQGIIVAGAVMLSPLLEGQLMFNADEFPFGAALELPSLAAAELDRHNAFDEGKQREAEAFALGNYLTTLAGPPPTGADAAAFYGRIAKLTGIPEDIVSRNRGFLGNSFVKHSDAGSGAVTSPYDAAFATPDPYPESDYDRGDDAILDGFVRAYGGAFADYARNDLGFKTEMTYSLLDSDISRRWEWGGGRGGGSRLQASATDDVRQLLASNTALHLLIAHGYSDLVTPYGVSRYVVDHLPPSLARGRVGLKLYRGGHMFYTNADQRTAFTADAKAFYATRPAAPPAD
ncbi:carboxypeptidase [Rhizobium hidalgonense]|uniref:Carboxypeptidase n=1 Tax=Rhizobium hidalgonense TaxID=1538159 RepID=A0A2A6KHD8_9HYPH|nr:carboxypeptidase [Rhizobium hidalgonense]MDR9774221.1 carboxypeptidase [Rhizobium hidalgonense]MDR9812019.1 carboxypeptidase [Rhizobium hidalgonense]MDR9820491.1 carboxypeptidase [Rhizobium hidalgonense]PDT23930.1 carboxypeptidase [Rhizobium hidalgonense]PON04087.1 carboxypeptidase [Rhizobium hidalgonense]